MLQKYHARLWRKPTVGGGVVKVDYPLPTEILEARRQVLHYSGEKSLDEMVRTVVRVTGFRRVGPDLSAVIEKILASATFDK